jgi:hypothetical protein
VRCTAFLPPRHGLSAAAKTGSYNFFSLLEISINILLLFMIPQCTDSTLEVFLWIARSCGVESTRISAR